MIKNDIQKKIKTKIIGKNIIYYESIDSTQIKARQLAENKIENGTIVLADEQYNGMGTHDRKWHTGSGKNLAFTMILYPKCDISKLDGLTINIAKCMVDTIYKLYNCKLVIKEPNDLMYDNKKVGGILTQVISSGDEIRYLLIGIGINVNEENFPEELNTIATSLKREFKQEFSREKIFCDFCKNFEEYIIDIIK